MKLIYKISTLIIIFVSVIFFACNNNSDHKNKPENKTYTGNAKIEFTDTIHDFGTLQEGEIVEYNFKYKNTGSAPLKIINIISDCGCTVPEYKKEELLPDNEGKIKVTFDSQGFRNNIYKTITVETNTDKKKNVLILTAFIKNNNSLNF